VGKKNNDGSLFERFMIIIFASSIVLLGAYPLSREYGGVRNYVSAKVDQVSNYLKNGEGKGGEGKVIVREENSKSQRARLKEPSSATSSNSKDSKTENSKEQGISNLLNSLF
jgi:hypothetical protein